MADVIVKPKAQKAGMALVVLALSLGFTLLVWMLASASQQSKAQARFTDEAVDLREVIRDRLLIFESTLFGVQGLFEASDTVTRSDFKQYISGHDGSRLQPGFQAIGFIQRVPADSANALVESVHAEGLTHFSIQDPAPGEEMKVIVYVEPFEGRNLRALGRNISKDAMRVAAIERSRDENMATITSRLHLMQEPAGSNTYGFIMYVPVYNNTMPSATVEQRRAAYIGSVYAAFRLPDLIEQALGRKGNLVDLEIFDAPSADPAHLFYERKARTAESADSSGLDPLTYPIQVGGRAWTLRFSPSPKFAAQLGGGFASAILASGIIISLLVFFIALSIDRNRNKAMAMAEDITRKLNDALSFQRVVLDGAAYSIIATEVDGTIRLMNAAAEKMLGYRANELVGKVTPAHFHEPNEIVERARQLSAETGQTVKPDFATFVARAKDGISDDGEWTFIRKDGTRLKVHLSVTRLMSAAGKLSGFLGVAYDLSDRKRAEEALRRSEQELLLTLDAAEIGTWDWDMSIQRIRWGGSHSTILGLTEAAQTPTTYNDFLATILPDDAIVIEHGVKQALESRQMTTMEFRIRRRDTGEIRWLSLRGRVYFDDHGVALRMVGIVRDVTKRRVAEETLREKTLALEHAVEGIAKLDTEGRIVEINRAYEMVAGYEPNELVGDKFSTLVNPVEWPQVQQSIETMWAAGKSEIECCGLRKDGFPFYMQCVLTHTFNGPGRGNGYYCFMKDITERKRAEEAVRAAREETEAANTHLAVVNQQLEDAIGKANEMAIRAEQANQAKSEFLATMSHEIRTPMNGIIGFTNLLCETDLNSEQHEFAETIRNSGQALLSLINDILDFSKIEAGKLSVEIMPFDLRQAVEESAELLSSTAEARGLQILLRVAPDCPCNLNGDPTRVRQVLLNLVGNAVKFTHEGHVLIDVRQEPSPDGAPRFVRCSVSDTGIGIPDSKQRQLFQPFSQADASTTRQYGGTGLGLAICKRLIELLGGKIGLHSTPEKGSTFWFTLPLAADAARVESTPVPEFSGRRALVLHNYPLSRELISDALRFWNMQVETASTFEGASMRLRECIQAPARAFDVVFAPLDLLQESNGMLSNVLSQAPFKGRTSVVSIARGNQRSDLRKLMGQTIHGSILTPIVRMEALATALRAVLRPDVIPASQSRASKAREAVPLPAVVNVPSRYRVLLADDNVVNQKLAVKMLEKLGCVVDVACNGSEAVTLSQQLPYDIVFMDCHMPEMDGFEATAEIRRLSGNGRRVPIVAVTADALQGDRERCLEAGMDGYISKPIKRDDLSKAIDAFCGQQVGT